MINIEQNRTDFIEVLRLTKRQNIDQLIDWLILETDFFTAPASSKYHLSVKGGLVEHKLSVFTTFWKLNLLFDLGFKLQTIIITSLLHDVCKANTYFWNEEKQKYKRDDTYPIGHGEKSVILIQRYIKLTMEEIALIRWHMGPYDNDYMRGQNYIKKVFPKIKALYFADDISTNLLEGENEVNKNPTRKS